MPKQSIDDLNARAAAIVALEGPFAQARRTCGSIAKFCAAHDGLRSDALCHWFASDRDRRIPGWANIRLLGRALVEGRFMSKKTYAQVCGEPYAKAS